MKRTRALTLSLLAIAGAPACATMRGTADEARFRRACVSVLHHEDARERTKLEEEVLARTRVVVRVRALAHEELFERIENALYPDDVTLLAYEVIDQGQPCCTTKSSVLLTTGSATWRPIVGRDLYTHAGLEPPVDPELDPKFSFGGLAVDALFGLLSAGQAPSKFRGTESWSPVVRPGRPASGTPEQHRAIARLVTAQGKPVVDEAWVGQSRWTSALLAPPAEASATELTLVVRVKLGLSEDQKDATCPFVVERRYPLPGAESAGRRISDFMKSRNDEIVIGGRR